MSVKELVVALNVAANKLRRYHVGAPTATIPTLDISDVERAYSIARNCDLSPGNFTTPENVQKFASRSYQAMKAELTRHDTHAHDSCNCGSHTSPTGIMCSVCLCEAALDIMSGLSNNETKVGMLRAALYCMVSAFDYKNNLRQQITMDKVFLYEVGEVENYKDMAKEMVGNINESDRYDLTDLFEALYAALKAITALVVVEGMLMANIPNLDEGRAALYKIALLIFKAIDEDAWNLVKEPTDVPEFARAAIEYRFSELRKRFIELR